MIAGFELYDSITQYREGISDSLKALNKSLEGMDSNSYLFKRLSHRVDELTRLDTALNEAGEALITVGT